MFNLSVFTKTLVKLANHIVPSRMYNSFIYSECMMRLYEGIFLTTQIVINILDAIDNEFQIQGF